MSACRSCRRPVRWVLTRGGRKMPLDPEPYEDGNVVLRTLPGLSSGELHAHVLADSEAPREGELRYKTHFVTCPDAGKHRRRR